MTVSVLIDYGNEHIVVQRVKTGLLCQEQCILMSHVHMILICSNVTYAFVIGCNRESCRDDIEIELRW